VELGRLFADFLDQGMAIYRGGAGRSSELDEPVVVTGASMGLPGADSIFGDENTDRMLHGTSFIDAIPIGLRRAMTDKQITRLVKSDKGGPRFETIDSPADVIKLAGRGGAIGLSSAFGIDEERARAMDSTTQMAIAAGLEALRDAGIPLVMQYKTTSKGTRLPERWVLPPSMQDDTGVIFGSAFPGFDMFADELRRHFRDAARREVLDELQSLRARLSTNGSGSAIASELDRRIQELQADLAREGYQFDRRFLFKVLSMGHAQLAEYIGARGPNTQINSACASGTQAVAIAEDWIARGRCRRVVVVTADNVTSDNLLEWVGSGFLASGAAATDELLEEAALPFDRRRHGLVLGMGASGIVIERADSARERGLRPIAEVLGTLTANSAYHGSRLNIEHIEGLMQKLMADCEAKHGIDRTEIAPQTVFVSHETYTPARGGSAQAEIRALRSVFGSHADQVVIANTKGMTGHAMGAGIEDATAVKILETGMVPPVANFKEIDPELGALNLSKGGSYPVHYALRLGAGFGSQVSMSLMRWVQSPDGRRPAPRELGYETRIEDARRFEQWLKEATGHRAADLEVVHRTLRVKDDGTDEPLPAKASPTASVSPPAAPAPAPAAASTPAPSAAPSSDPVTDKVLAIVSEQTGYPSDMLDLDLDLEADLGIDTVKQAETFAAVREAYDIPRDDNLELRQFPTLQHVAQFVRDRRPDLAVSAPTAAPASSDAAAAAPAPAPSSDPVTDKVLAIVSEQTGYPSDMLDLDLDLEADLGIDTVKQAETFAAVREAYDIPRDDNLELREFPTLQHVVQFVRDRRPDLAPSAPAPSAVPESTEAAAPPSASTEMGSIETKVLEVVSEVTGYPSDMLELDLDLEADLGIDTVKQAETFAAVREAYGIARDDNLELRDFPTLNHVIAWVKDRLPEVGEGSATKADEPRDADSARGRESSEGLRRVPVPVLRPPLSLCKPTKVELTAGARVVVMPDRGGVFRSLSSRLQKRGVEVLAIEGTPSAEALIEQLEAWQTEAPIHGVYWLAALDREAPIGELTPDDWNENVQRRAKLLYSTMRTLYDQVSSAGTFLLAGTRFGGKHGFDEHGASAPLGGAVTGFTKTFKREKPDAAVKVVDFETEAKPSVIAERLIEETLTDPGVCELGYTGDDRWAITARLEEAEKERVHPLGKDTVFVITGAAGSIVSAIVADLAQASGGTFHLLDLTPEPDSDDPDLERFRTDREGLQRELFERLKQSGQKATPVAVQKQLAGLERKHAALAAIEAVEAAGGRAHYHCVNLLDKDAVDSVVESIAGTSKRIDVLVHAAGLEISHFLPDKSASEFDLVFDVKATGWYHLLSSIGDLPLGAAVVFSSIAGRFGNGGQTDYSAANELLAKSVSSFRNARPQTRGIALDWTAWADIGMASRGSIPKMMELAGIDMLKPSDGIPVVRRELETGFSGEAVIGGALGLLLEEWDDTGGLDPSVLESVRPSLMQGRVVAMGVHSGLTVETTLDPKEQPFLYDHRIGGTPVLPGVMGLEGFAEITSVLFPEWHVSAIESVEFLAPFKFYRDEPRTLTWAARFETDGEDVLARCELIGVREIMGRQEVKTHFTAVVRLSRGPSEHSQAEAPPAATGATVADRDIYQVYFHGPAYRVIDTAWRSDGVVVGRMSSQLPDDHVPADTPLLIEPRLVELCFQTAGVWQIGTTGRMGLPQHIDRVAVLRRSDGAQGLHAIVTPRSGGEAFDAQVVDEAGHVYVSLSGYRTAELPDDVQPDKRDPLRTAMD
jgi:3-oxoacyl-(acyl-carrier-protein) synthase/NAD(P)-dependent dehydrogenase (short-subunit alcohol dehydrogenase family)/acyl carrier protein